MAKVLTTASKVQCPHGFAITFHASAALRVAGALVVRESDLANALIPCTSQAKCTAIAAPLPSARALRDGNSPVLLASGLSTNIGACTVLDAGHALMQTE